MAIRSTRVTVGTSATRLDVFSAGVAGTGFMARSSIALLNTSTSTAVAVDGPAVDAATSAELQASMNMTIDISSDNGGIYGRVASGSVRVDVVQREVL